ncbi:MAG: hypothetical protein GF310_14455, partial [candidate division Zixibacteria bacterium]|nr:hypothetical protein [candidate division Zixibacteria bacterium]
MKTERIERNVRELTSPDLNTEEITEFDQQAYLNLVSTELSPDQIKRIVTPAEVYYTQDSILAVHWHPEFISRELIMKRVRASFPNSDLELIIPTQHNDL